MDPESIKSATHDYEQIVPEKTAPTHSQDSISYGSYSVESPMDGEGKGGLGFVKIIFLFNRLKLMYTASRSISAK